MKYDFGAYSQKPMIIKINFGLQIGYTSEHMACYNTKVKDLCVVHKVMTNWKDQKFLIIKVSNKFKFSSAFML